jgi:hypothetical protein
MVDAARGKCCGVVRGCVFVFGGSGCVCVVEGDESSQCQMRWIGRPDGCWSGSKLSFGSVETWCRHRPSFALGPWVQARSVTDPEVGRAKSAGRMRLQAFEVEGRLSRPVGSTPISYLPRPLEPRGRCAKRP